MMTTMRKRILPLGMAVFLLLAACAAAFSPVWAIAEGAPAPTEVPMESVSPYRIILTAPGGWTSGTMDDLMVGDTIVRIDDYAAGEGVWRIAAVERTEG